MYVWIKREGCMYVCVLNSTQELNGDGVDASSSYLSTVLLPCSTLQVYSAWEKLVGSSKNL